ncbi:MAG: DNA repair protein RadC [Phascolarctobacterium sp.]|nr:DNA repair protein RadC [Candidatus Phascolarctobacterium caballi]MCQ2380790.1 DNA repair protein RadC [Acidaminococcaceae bacterium]
MTKPKEGKEEWPRERLERLGAASLSDSEIIAILLCTGYRGKSVLEFADELTANGRLYTELAHMNTVQEFKRIKGLGGEHKSSVLLAAIELGRRIAKKTRFTQKSISKPEDVYNLLAPDLRDEVQEHFYVLGLNNKNKLLGVREISKGTLNGSLVHQREVFKQAVLFNAAKIIVVHNHPSGEPSPSQDDRNVTRMLYDAGNVMNIPLADHVIIGDGEYYSFSDNGLI